MSRSGWEGAQDFDLGAVFTGDDRDPERVRTVMRVFNLLELPDVLFDLMPAPRGPGDERPARPREPRVKGPTRDDLLAVVA